jgi:hypothetical protein
MDICTSKGTVSCPLSAVLPWERGQSVRCVLFYTGWELVCHHYRPSGRDRRHFEPTVAGGAHTLFYGKLGAAVSRVAVSEFSPGSAVTTAVPFSFSGAKNVWGLAAGGGVEWAFNPSWSLKAEYEYLGLRKTVAACGSLPPSAAGAGGPWCTQGGIGGVQSLKAGINYRFNSWPMAAQ